MGSLGRPRRQIYDRVCPCLLPFALAMLYFFGSSTLFDTFVPGGSANPLAFIIFLMLYAVLIPFPLVKMLVNSYGGYPLTVLPLQLVQDSAEQYLCNVVRDTRISGKAKMQEVMRGVTVLHNVSERTQNTLLAELLKSACFVVTMASVMITSKSFAIAAIAGSAALVMALGGFFVLIPPMMATYRYQRLEQLAASVCARVEDETQRAQLSQLVLFLNGVRPAWMLFEIPLTPMVVFSILNFFAWVIIAVGAAYGFSAARAYNSAANATGVA